MVWFGVVRSYHVEGPPLGAPVTDFESLLNHSKRYQRATGMGSTASTAVQEEGGHTTSVIQLPFYIVSKCIVPYCACGDGHTTGTPLLLEDAGTVWRWTTGPPQDSQEYGLLRA